MTEPDDYLFDPAAAPDPELQALERALQPLRFPGGALPLPAAPARQRRPRWPWLLAAALLVGGALVLGWPRALDALHPAAPAQRFVAAAAPRSLRLGELATVVLQPGAELEFVHWRPDQALFRLAQGSIDVQVAPPPAVAPGFFCVDTPRGRVVDQGCRYSLQLTGDGDALVQVREGAVTFEAAGGAVFVPAGAATRATAGGYTTPVFTTASPALRAAVRGYDRARAAGQSDEVRRKTVRELLEAAAEPRDTLPLWHLLRDPEPEFQELAAARLEALVGSLPGPPTRSAPVASEPWLGFLRGAAWQAGGR